MDYLNYFKRSFSYYNKTFYRYNYHHYIGYEINIKNISELDKMISEYRKCHWVVRIYPPPISYYKFVDSSDQKEICPICRNSKLDIKTICFHCFHLKCLEGWLRIKPDCPVCRSKLLTFNDLYRVTMELDLYKMKEIIDNGTLMSLAILLNMGAENALKDKIEESRIRKLLSLEIRFIAFSD